MTEEKTEYNDNETEKGRVERVDLPSGGWWELYVPTKHRHIKQYGIYMREQLKDNEVIMDATVKAVLYWTHGWSFDGLPRSLESYDDVIDLKDTNAAEVFFTETIAPLVNPTGRM